MAKKSTIFVGSSSEGLDVAEAVQVSLGRDYEVTLWTQGVFLLGLANLENLTRILGSYDFAVLVLTPDDITSKRAAKQEAARDNVIFELGLFMGAIGRDRAFALVDRTTNMHIPTDLAGIALASYEPNSSGNVQASVSPACAQIKQSIRELGPRVNRSIFGQVPGDLFWLGHDLAQAIRINMLKASDPSELEEQLVLSAVADILHQCVHHLEKSRLQQSAESHSQATFARKRLLAALRLAKAGDEMLEHDRKRLGLLIVEAKNEIGRRIEQMQHGFQPFPWSEEKARFDSEADHTE